jgi:anaerobic selenocysteine-containing dehydrogenase/Fe-S-cluster-containing dehydrogenase component
MANGIGRRGFFKIVGVSSAAAAAAGCGKTTEAILPYVIPAENVVPGVPSWYATVCRECPAGCGVLAKHREGRVVKVEGNPDHPVNRGALCARGQASLLGTYDPDRLPRPLRRDAGSGGKAGDVADAERGFVPIEIAEAVKLVAERVEAARKAGAGRIAILSQLETGSLGRLMDEWLKAVGGRPRVALEPFAHESLRAANRLTFGLDAIPHHAFEEARAVLALGADYLETWLSPVGHAAGFRRLHAVAAGTAGTVIHVEPRYSMTAAAADEWVANVPGTEGLIAQAVLRLVLERGLPPGLAPREAETLTAAASAVDVEAVARASGVPVERLRHIADVLMKGAPSLVVGGGVAVAGAGATDTGVAINLLNVALGNVGRTVRFGPNLSIARASRYADVLALGESMAKGEIDVLIVKDANPVYALPAKAGFAEALARVPFVVSWSSHRDETTARAHLVIPDLTPLESWGDFSPQEGVVGLMQPAMGPVPRVGPRREDALDVPVLRPVARALGQEPGPVFPGVQTRPAGDVLLDLGRALVPGSEKGPFQAKTFADYVRQTWQELQRSVAPGVPFDQFWEGALRRGGVWTDVPLARVSVQPGIRLAAAPPALEGGADGPALMIVPSSRFYDGRSANKAWLHETPDPMTQVVYDGWVEIETGAARRLGIEPGAIVRVTSPHGQVELPAYVSETLHPGAVAIPTGLGHTEYGRWATGRGQALGRNPMVLLPGAVDPASGGPRWLSVRVALAKTGRRAKLASPAGVTEVDHRREIIESISLQEFAGLQRTAKTPEHANLPSMYPDVKYPEHRWGMVIDLDACTGCQACVVACQAENNVPLVGRADIDYGRSLQWLRVERWWERGHGGGARKGGHAEGGPGLVATAEAAEGPAKGRPAARFMPMLCQHCEVAPCEPVCPVFAAYHTSEGLNAQVYNRCVGTRYCGNNCPYMVRRFNWYRYDQYWPAPMPLVLNPDVTVRDRGVMEKCTMCVQRIIAGKDQARTEKRRLGDGEILTACQQTCPTQAITFGDLKDGRSAVSQRSVSPRGYHVLGELATRPAVTYLKKVTKEPA